MSTPWGAAATPGPTRPDASMELLNAIVRESVDPEYAGDAGDAGTARRSTAAQWLVVAVMVVAGVMFATAAVESHSGAPMVAQERAELIERIQAGERQQARLRAQVGELDADIARLEAQALGSGNAVGRLTTELGVATGATAVTGPGLVIEADDPEQPTPQTRIIDQDLAVVANGLWTAGAEAVSINGHRLTSRTAIREAGTAVTVDYVSLSPPYRIEAIGDPRTLPASFDKSPGGTWLSYLKENFSIRVSISTSKSLRLPADPGLKVTHARSGS